MEKVMMAKLIVGIAAVLFMSACTTGGMVQFGYLPVTAIDHRQVLEQEKAK